ncbi:MAG: hypothetical protein Q8L47_03560 [bacterium]|nr:hypothetical protein [bacterium]
MTSDYLNTKALIFGSLMSDKMTMELNIMKSNNLLQEKTSIFGLSDFRGHRPSRIIGPGELFNLDS